MFGNTVIGKSDTINYLIGVLAISLQIHFMDVLDQVIERLNG